MIVLMYHALYSNESELQALLEEERSYAVSTDDFRQQLEVAQSLSGGFVDPVKMSEAYAKPASGKNKVLLTFDDGHISFYTHAMPIMAEFSAKGIFFITPQLRDTRDDFCSWDQLKALLNNGHAVESHGDTHRFFTTMSDAESAAELESSKNSLDSQLKQQTTMISFPGGRYSKRDIDAGRKMGYEYFFTSEVGVSQAADVSEFLGIKRFALRNNTALEEFKKIISGDSIYFAKLKLVSSIKSTMKKIVGDNGYHLLYKLIKR